MNLRFSHKGSWLLLITGVWSLIGCETSPTYRTGAVEDSYPAQDHIVASGTASIEALEERAHALHHTAQYDAARSLIHQAIARREERDEIDSKVLLADYALLGRIELDTARLAEAERALHKARRLSVNVTPPDLRGRIDVLVELGRVRLEQGKIDAARTLFEEAHALAQTASERSASLAMTLNGIAQVALVQGDLIHAGEAFAKAAEMWSVVSDKQPAEEGMALNGLAQVRRRQGRFVEARQLVEQAINVRERAFGPSHPQVTRVLVTLIEIMQQLGQSSEALPIAQNVLRLDEKTFGPRHPTVALRLNTLAQIHTDLGSVSEALGLREQAYAIQKAVFGESNFQLAQTLIETAMLHLRLRDYSKAVMLVERAIGIQEKTLGPQSVYIAGALDLLGSVEIARGNYSKAGPLYERARAIRESALGHVHPDVATSFANLAVFYHSQGHLDKARPFYEEARQIAMQGGYISSHLDEASSRRIWTSDTDRLKNYARLLLALAVQRPSATSLHADAFEVLEQARGWVVQSTIARMLARRAGKTPEERRLTDRLEELRKERSLLWSKLQQSYASADTGEHKAEPNELKRNLSQVEQELDSLGKQVRRLLPRYAELSTPGTIPVAEAQQYLGTGEALISYYYLDRGLKTWVVRPGQPVAFYDVQIEHDVLTSLVKALRDSLSPEYGAYNIGAARRLYQLLIGPLESKLEGCTHLLIVPDPLMVGLPFPALIAPSMVTTQPDRRPDDLRAVRTNYAALPWLVRKYASTVLPSASSLRLIRQRSGEASASIPFMGFGNPLLRHTQPTTPSADTKQTSSMSGRELPTRAVRIFTDLQPLPGTSRELAAVARALHADPDRHLYMGEQATEATVKRLSREGILGHAEIVSFATHALVPSEFEGIMQPTLVMTPPATGTDEDDGLLSMEEILELELGHTWWVILSACNTGFGATSEQGLSGLARSFFYAGARSLLVSHWSVDDHATEVLMKQIFQRYGDNPHLSPAEAIRGGMLALLDGTSGDPYPFLTHPYAWASFFLIGEGSRRPGL